jgi:uracil-DNA glycosylase family 4
MRVSPPVLSRQLKGLANPRCDLCPLYAGAKSVCVPGDGVPRYPLLILGEAPGRDEDARNRPFVGRSGVLLRSELSRAGLPLEKCYMTNTVKCFPGRTPNEDEIKICSKNYLRKEIELLLPSFALVLGGVGLNYFFPGKRISDYRGQLHETKGIFIFPTWHPAYVLRNKSALGFFRKDLENFVALVKLEIDGKLG